MLCSTKGDLTVGVTYHHMLVPCISHVLIFNQENASNMLKYHQWLSCLKVQDVRVCNATFFAEVFDRLFKLVVASFGSSGLPREIL